MSYTDYLNRKKINTPVILKTDMRFPDASSFTWRTKLAATRVLPNGNHVINNNQDVPAPRLFSPAATSYPGNGFGGKVQDASTFTLSRGARALGDDKNSFAVRYKTPTLAATQCLTRPPPSQVVAAFRNADNNSNAGIPEYRTRSILQQNTGTNMSWKTYAANGLNMAYMDTCPTFNPLTKTYSVDRLPALRTNKVGTVSVAGDRRGRQVVQNPITGITSTDTTAPRSTYSLTIPFNNYSRRPVNPAKAAFITGIQGPQTGGGGSPGQRAAVVGGATLLVKRTYVNPFPGAYVRSKATLGYTYPEGYRPNTGIPHKRL